MPHMLMRTAAVAGATTLASAMALAVVPLAATAAPGAPTSGAATVKVQPLKGYRTVTGAVVASPTNTQRRGTAQCPTGTVPLGGGVLTQSRSTLVSLNSSFPVGTGWAADISNVSDADTTFEVEVVCAVKPPHYVRVRSKDRANPAATHTTISAACPTGTRPLGGGAASSSGSPFITLSSTAPAGPQSWQISENNATGQDATLAVFALCGSVKGYSVLHSPVSLIPGRSIASLGIRCPVGRFPTGGGAVIQSSSVGAYLNLSGFGDSQDWVSFVTNTAAVPFKASSTLVCAQAPA